MSIKWHTSKDIIGTKGDVLRDKSIVLCITGSVAAIRSAEIARELMRLGADVNVVMSPMAQKIIHPYLMEWATGNPVITELTGQVEHVTLAGEHPRKADLILVAPCTANTIGKVAAGIDDTPVTTMLTTAIGSGIPIIIVPAMHGSMYLHPIVLENIKKLESLGIEVLMPRIEEGKAKIPDTNEIVKAVVKRLTTDRDLEGLRILVTAGPTREYLDAFRFISNPSSGKMGVAIAKEALRRGAEITLIYGPGAVEPPIGVELHKVESTEEMLKATVMALKEKKHHIAILAAAAADYGPIERQMVKTPSGLRSWHLRLRPLPKIVEKIKEVSPETYLVGFKAEYDVSERELIDRAYKRLQEADMDLIVANDISKKGIGFGYNTNEVYIIDGEKRVIHIPKMSKLEVARRLLNHIRERLQLL